MAVKKRNWIVAVLAVLIVAGAGSAAFVARHYTGRALPGTTVAGQSVAGQTQQQIQEDLDQRVADTQVTVDVAGTPAVATLADLGVTVDTAAMARQALAHDDSWTTRLAGLLDAPQVSTAIATDDAVLGTYVDGLIAQVGQPARDATVTFDAESEEFIANEGQAGQTIDPEPLRQAAQTAAQTLEPQSAQAQVIDAQPAFTTEQALQVAAQADDLIAPHVAIGDGISDYVATAEEKAQWVGVDTTSGTPAAVIDQAQVRTWVDARATDFNEPAVNGVHNVDAAGTVVATAREGKAGYTVNNAQQVFDGLVAALGAGEDYQTTFDFDRTPEPTWETRTVAPGAENLAYPAAVGEKWVDIDLTAATVTAYEGATVVRGPMPMVPGEPATPTVQGTFQVYLKYQSQTMRGQNTDGSEYVTPDVPWVTYFHGGYAMHGAPWRSSFGWTGPGGSHGCVNMPVDAAKFIYEWADMGTTVVSHS